ncbi:ATP-grasp domain-containing protein [Peribacillus glennii]|uniref:ATP-grasp domain-containing protein n=1 Tax=Peribacillus glennii TaxID=2303991 RepID=A0A372LD29_9BACI|nr:ATP-grasp domain-containing protein [Peribacillus glennii]RFU63909.1 ATP-grasp domain-containing protein [Peribacillus glennii]
MDSIVFIGTNKSGSSREAVRAAKRLGFYTIVFTDRLQFMEQISEFPDVDEMILTDLSNRSTLKTAILKLKKEGKTIQGILSFIDPYVHVAAALAEQICTSIVSSKQILNMEDKTLTRRLLKNHSVSPYFAIFQPEDSLQSFLPRQEKHLPLIVKSPKSAGSKDVLPATSKKQLKSAIKKLAKKYRDTPVLLEEFISGPQYLIEAVVHNATVHIIAVIAQEITFQQRFIVTGYSLIPHMEKQFYDSIHDTVASIVQALKLKNGACHLEMRLAEGQWKLIEVNPRISGGAMNRIIEIGYGINLVEETIQLYLGNEPRLARKHSKYVYAHYLTASCEGTLSKVTGRERASNYPGVEEVFIKPRKGKFLRPPLSMGDRYGYVLASSDTSIEEAKKIAEQAAKEISFHLEDEYSYLSFI